MMAEGYLIDEHRTGLSERRFGTIAMEKGFITHTQLIEALKIQISEEVTTGKRTPIGKILFNQRLITFSQLTEVVLSLESGNVVQS